MLQCFIIQLCICILGCHIVVTSRPHTLSHLQSSRWFLSLPKRMVSLDIQGLSEEGVQSFIHSYVDARQFSDNDSRLYAVANHASGKITFHSFHKRVHVKN